MILQQMILGFKKHTLQQVLLVKKEREWYALCHEINQVINNYIKQK